MPGPGWDFAGRVSFPAPRKVFLTAENARFIDEANRIAERIDGIKRFLSPRLGRDLLIQFLARQLPRYFKNGFEIIYGEIEVVGIGLRIEIIAVGAGIEADEDCSAAVEIMAPGADTFSGLGEQLAV